MDADLESVPLMPNDVLLDLLAHVPFLSASSMPRLRRQAILEHGYMPAAPVPVRKGTLRGGGDGSS
jgi:hypothetical protein